MVQQVKDPALSLQCLKSLLWHEFGPWPRNFHRPQLQPKKRKDVPAPQPCPAAASPGWETAPPCCPRRPIPALLPQDTGEHTTLKMSQFVRKRPRSGPLSPHRSLREITEALLPPTLECLGLVSAAGCSRCLLPRGVRPCSRDKWEPGHP